MIEYKRYYVIRTKMRTDGDIDFEKSEEYSQANAYNKYYTLKAAAYTDTTYPQIAISIFNYELIQIEHCVVTTQYVEPEVVEETEPESDVSTEETSSISPSSNDVSEEEEPDGEMSESNSTDE